MYTRGQCESVVELLRRILARPHEIFEVSRCIGRRWRVGHGAALQSNSRGYPGTWPSITVGFCNSTGEHDRMIMQDRLSTIWSLAVAGAGARPASAGATVRGHSSIRGYGKSMSALAATGDLTIRQDQVRFVPIPLQN